MVKQWIKVILVDYLIMGFMVSLGSLFLWMLFMRFHLFDSGMCEFLRLSCIAVIFFFCIKMMRLQKHMSTFSA